MVKVLISDKMSPLAAQVFREQGIEVDEIVGLSKEELADIIHEYDGLAVRSASKVTEKVLRNAKNLKVVGRAGIGVDNIDVPFATQCGVAVMNTPFGNSITTAEHAIAMMMACARDIPAADASTRAGKWEKSKFMGVEVFGKTLGVIGCGNIGSIVVDRAQGLKMKVMGYDPYLSDERAKELGIKKVELDELFAHSDFITLHTPLTDATRNVINKAAFKKMKDGVRIINCARGGLVNEEDLAEALKSGKVGGAAFDVFTKEPATENVLFDMPNVVATPHLGAATTEAQVNVARQVAEQMSDFLLTGAVSNAINLPSISAEDAPVLKPYMVLAEQIGSLAGQLLDGEIQKVTVEYEGHVAGLNTKALTGVVLEGVLRSVMQNVNIINAPIIARERNIDIAEVTHDRESHYQTLIRLRVQTPQGENSISGTLFANKMPRIVNIRGVDMEAELSNHMLYVANDDKPGFIGALGMVLSEAEVNIATFNLGRKDGAGFALCIVSVDAHISKKVEEKVASLPHVRQVKALTF